jgi:predicted transcriptional regulator
MATQTGPEFIAVSADARRVVREVRTQLGLSRATLEQRAKVGTDYLKHLELGRHPTVEATRLRRVVRALQQAAARGQVPAQLATRLARVIKAVA